MCLAPVSHSFVSGIAVVLGKVRFCMLDRTFVSCRHRHTFGKLLEGVHSSRKSVSRGTYKL